MHTQMHTVDIVQLDRVYARIYDGGPEDVSLLGHNVTSLKAQLTGGDEMPAALHISDASY